MGMPKRLHSSMSALKYSRFAFMRSSEYPNMPGVIGSGACPFLAAHVAGVSRKLKNSYSAPIIALKPIFSARASTPFSSWRGQAGWGEPSASTKSPRKNGTSPSQGTWRCVERSIRTSASG